MTLRPIQLPNDLDILEHVAYESFQYPENPDWGVQEDERENIRSEVDALRRIWPMVRFVSLFYPRFRDILGGYIWEEDGQPAGIVLMEPAAIMGGPAWVVGTLGVLPAYRRRGIARYLVEAGINMAREKGARTITLRVISQNKPAYELYRNLGFTHYATATEMEREADAPLPEAPSLPPGYRIAELSSGSWRPLYGLEKRLTPAEVQAFRPVEKSNYHPPALVRLITRVLDRFSGRQESAFAVVPAATQTAPGDEPHPDEVLAVARYGIRTKAGGVNILRVRLDPEHADLSPFLLRRAVREIVKQSPGRRIAFSQPDWGRSLVDAGWVVGFGMRNEWHQMGLLLGS
jgi:GNAT superfamily N-acetyltransferase